MTRKTISGLPPATPKISVPTWVAEVQVIPPRADTTHLPGIKVIVDDTFPRHLAIRNEATYLASRYRIYVNPANALCYSDDPHDTGRLTSYTGRGSIQRLEDLLWGIDRQVSKAAILNIDGFEVHHHTTRPSRFPSYSGSFWFWSTLLAVGLVTVIGTQIARLVLA
jgi:hypothetical protein